MELVSIAADESTKETVVPGIPVTTRLEMLKKPEINVNSVVSEEMMNSMRLVLAATVSDTSEEIVAG